MPRRVSLPGAAELFRTTPAESRHQPLPTPPEVDVNPPEVDVNGSEPDPAHAPATQRRTETKTDADDAAPARPKSGSARKAKAAGGSGRVRHDEKITVYVSNDELLDLERARLSLRAEHGMAVDRGRIVREALALVIGDLAEHGADSDLVRRLSES